MDGICGVNTTRTIIAYQRHFYHHPDGLVSPDKKTFELLILDTLSRSSLPHPEGATGINPKGVRTNPKCLKASYQCTKLMRSYETFQGMPYNDQTKKL